jgi:hypothetical protein
VWRTAKRLIKAARSPRFASQIGTPTPRFAAPWAALTAAPPPAPEAPSSILKTAKMETAMTSSMMISNVRCDALADALQAEFGGILAARILEAEALDFLWEARVAERYLGQHIGDELDAEDASQELSRLLILSHLMGVWHVGLCLVDGEGTAVDLLWKRPFGTRAEAELGFAQAR